ncbi:MAG: ribosome biogenesis GTPase Der [Nitrospiraceae bacterium]|nr:MAG: ribosome biogenesis GTPase Der [Nitrospiraceae bacterium]
MNKPVIVIVGRPNVGKSTLFNRITRSQAAIVEAVPGVTRDRNYRDATWEGKTFMVVDTGGFYLEPPEDVFVQAKEQAFFAIEEGDIIIHLLDGKDGLTPADMELARLLRASGKSVVWAVNKIDAESRIERMYEFYRIGTEELIPVSAATGYGYETFMNRMHDLLPYAEIEIADYPKIAVVGRPNVGKSTLVNALTGKQKIVVSSVPGTTRDALDSICTYHGRKYVFIDTAGLRKKGKIGYALERFSMVRTVRSIERCDVALLILDAGQGIVEQDQRIAGMIKDYGKGTVFLLNKWDLVQDPERAYDLLSKDVEGKMWFSSYAPFLTVSGLVKKRIFKVYPVIDTIMAERRKRIRTAELNRFFQAILSEITLPQYKNKKVKWYYMTQVKEEPPSFVLFVNYPEAVKTSHTRFIEKKLRESFGFQGTPLNIYVRPRKREKKR